MLKQINDSLASLNFPRDDPGRLLNLVPAAF
jgi:hypothetical protein